MKKIYKIIFRLIVSVMLLININPITSYALTSKSLPSNATALATISQGSVVIKNNNVTNINSKQQLLNIGGSSSLENSVTIDWKLQADSVNRKIIDKFTISKIQGIPPTGIAISQYLLASNYGGNDGLNRMSWYHTSIFDNLGAYWAGSQIYVGNSKSETVPAETKFWSITGSASASYTDGNGEHSSEIHWDPPYVAINRTGHIFPDYYDAWSGKKASDGLCTNWQKVTNPVEWNNVLRGQAITQYIDLYKDPKYDWSQYQIHHIRPRAYGGSNDITNLIPIPQSKHEDITSWFAGY